MLVRVNITEVRLFSLLIIYKKIAVLSRALKVDLGDLFDKEV